MRGRAFAGDRIVLFTLVDLLLQTIFCGFLLYAANRASQGEIQDKIARLAQTFGISSVSTFLDATSKLVAIKDLGRIDIVATTDNSTVLDEATKMLGGLSQADLSTLAEMDVQQRRAFMKMFAALRPADRQLVGKFVNRYGSDLMRTLARADVAPDQFRAFLASIALLPPGDRRKFVQLGVTFAKADSNKRQKIVDAAANVVKPPCFNNQPALHITEVSGGYVIRPLIGAIIADVRRAWPSGVSVGQTFSVGESAFSQFASVVAAANPTCYIQVSRDSQTYDERQLLKIQRWFGTP